MSGDSEAPPTYYFSGITFNPDFYQSTSGSYLTQTTAKNYFLTYPSAQGTETITTLNSSSINSSSEASDLSIVSSQTSGVLNIGTGARTTAGNINIGTGSGTVVNPIAIGGASSAIAMNGTCTFAKQISASLGMTSAGNIAVTSTSGTITAPSGGFLIGPYKNAATSSASITAAGVITGTKLVTPTVDCASSGTSLYLGSNLDTGNIFLGSAISTGNITIGRESGNHTGVITIGGSQTTGIMEIATKSTRTGDVFFCSTTGQTNNIYIGASGTKTILDGTVSSNSLNGLSSGAAQTIGGIITTGSISIGGALTSGSMTLGGVQTTGDINIGNKNATGDIYIGNGTNSTTGANQGICSIQKLQVGNTTLNSGNGVGTGTPFRCVIVERNVGSTTSATGTYTIPGAPTGAGNPIVFASINSGNSNYWIVVSPASAATFTYQKSYWTGTGFGPATNENFNYVAYWL